MSEHTPIKLFFLCLLSGFASGTKSFYSLTMLLTGEKWVKITYECRLTLPQTWMNTLPQAIKAARDNLFFLESESAHQPSCNWLVATISREQLENG